jgi:LytS/YehU family sensor histidine kinase
MIMENLMSMPCHSNLPLSAASANDAEKMHFLKAQIHPHFLFNTLNNIYFLLLTGSPKAPEAIRKMESLLQFVLKQGEAETVPLETEITVIRDYLELERIMYMEEISINLDISIASGNLMIAPLLLLPFVENVFKHGINKVTNQPWMRLKIRTEQNHLRFHISNSSLNPPPSIVKERLQLLYPGRHAIHVSNKDNQFSVELNIRLDQLSNPVTTNLTAKRHKSRLIVYNTPAGYINYFRYQRRKQSEYTLKSMTGGPRPEFMFGVLRHIQEAASMGSSNAQTLLMNFSEWLSYTIYDCNADQVPMEKEVCMMTEYLYLKNLNHGGQRKLIVRKVGNLAARHLPPFLILPIIDLCFQIPTSYPEQRWLEMGIGMEGDRFILKLIHGMRTEQQCDGLALHPDVLILRKRLDIFYPGNHQFKLFREGETYMVSLDINMESIQVNEKSRTPKRKTSYAQPESLSKICLPE